MYTLWDAYQQYKEARAKKHGVKPSRRLAFTLVLIKYLTIHKYWKVLRILMFRLPEHFKTSRRERVV